MFDSLIDQMKKDERESTNSRERVVIWVVTAVLAVALFGGVYLATRLIG